LIAACFLGLIQSGISAAEDVIAVVTMLRVYGYANGKGCGNFLSTMFISSLEFLQSKLL